MGLAPLPLALLVGNGKGPRLGCLLSLGVVRRGARGRGDRIRPILTVGSGVGELGDRVCDREWSGKGRDERGRDAESRDEEGGELHDGFGLMFSFVISLLVIEEVVDGDQNWEVGG